MIWFVYFRQCNCHGGVQLSLMAARTRASFTDDDSISDHLILEMVRINAPQTASTMIHHDLDERATSNESVGTPATNDPLSTSNPTFVEGVDQEYGIPNLFTYKKVSSKEWGFVKQDEISRSNRCWPKCKMKIQVSQSNPWRVSCRKSPASSPVVIWSNGSWGHSMPTMLVKHLFIDFVFFDSLPPSVSL